MLVDTLPFILSKVLTLEATQLFDKVGFVGLKYSEACDVASCLEGPY